MDSHSSINDVIGQYLNYNPYKTLVYISVGSAEVIPYEESSSSNNSSGSGGGGYSENSNDNDQITQMGIRSDPSVRASSQQLPPFIRKYMKNYPEQKIITIMIDTKFNIKPKIIKDTYVEKEIGKSVKLYIPTINSDSSEPCMIITIEEAVRWAEPRHECEEDLMDIRNFIKNIALNCYHTKCCMIMESFTGDSLFKLRNFIDIECNNYIQFLDKCMIGLTVNSNYCHPDLTSKEYDINIHFTEETGIYIDNPHNIIKYPELYKKVFAKSLTSDYSLAIRLSKLLNLKAEIVCDSILTLARMAISLSLDYQSVNCQIYDDIMKYTNTLFDVNIIDKVDVIFDLLSEKTDELFKFLSCTDCEDCENVKRSILDFKISKKPYNDFILVKKYIMKICPCI